MNATSVRRESRRSANEAQMIRVLIAAPEEPRLGSYRTSLADEGFEVRVVTTGLDCVSQLRDSTPDVLVLDPDLLWGGGGGVLAMMREEPSVPSVPTLIRSKQICPDGLCDRGFPVVDCEDRRVPPIELGSLIRHVVGYFGRRPPPSSRSKVGGHRDSLAK